MNSEFWIMKTLGLLYFDPNIVAWSLVIKELLLIACKQVGLPMELLPQEAQNFENIVGTQNILKIKKTASKIKVWSTTNNITTLILVQTNEYTYCHCEHT